MWFAYAADRQSVPPKPPPWAWGKRQREKAAPRAHGHSAAAAGAVCEDQDHCSRRYASEPSPDTPTNTCPHRRRVHDLLHCDGARLHSVASLWPCLPRRVYRCVGEHRPQPDVPIMSSADPYGHTCRHATTVSPSAILRRLRPSAWRQRGHSSHTSSSDGTPYQYSTSPTVCISFVLFCS